MLSPVFRGESRFIYNKDKGENWLSIEPVFTLSEIQYRYVKIYIQEANKYRKIHWLYVVK